MRPAATLRSLRLRWQPAGWALLLSLLVGCLNPQPDPYPQNNGAPQPNASAYGPRDVQRVPEAPSADNSMAGAVTAPATPSRGNSSEQAPTAATPPPPAATAAPPDAGAPPPDAGEGFDSDAGVPANGL